MEDKIKQFLKTMKLNESLLSMFFGVVTVVLVGVLVFRVYNSNKPEITEQAEETAQPSVETMGEVKVMTDEDGKKYPTELPESYKVEKGDHLWKIAEKFYGSGYNWVDIAKENGLSNPGEIEVGQELKLPKSAVIELKTTAMKDDSKMEMSSDKPSITGDSYKVVKGDNLWEIAVRAYGDGYKWTEIAKKNELAHPNYIEVDQELKLPR